MPIPWLAVLKSVPWSEVISNAPKVVDAAKKLWKAVDQNPPPEDFDSTEQSGASPEFHAIAATEARVIALEAAVSDLHGQMLASSELIKALADQNAQLIQRIETNRVRLLWLCAETAVVAIAALFGLFLAVSHHGT